MSVYIVNDDGTKTKVDHVYNMGTRRLGDFVDDRYDYWPKPQRTAYEAATHASRLRFLDVEEEIT